MKYSVVYWNNIPAPYMVERFNALVDRGNIDFEVWFNDRIESDRSWKVDESSWRFRYQYLPTTLIGRRRLHWPTQILGRRPDVLVSLYAEPSFVLGWFVARMRRVKTCFRVLMTHDRWVKRHPAKDALKRFMFKRVDGVETPGNDGKQFAIRYGAPSKHIYIATHTVDIAHYQQACMITQTEREAIRRGLGVIGTVFIYVGRLWWGKGINHLLEAFLRVQQLTDDEVSLLLLGDGTQEADLKRYCIDHKLRNVAFAGFHQKPELPCYYAAADVFVFPTLGDPYGIVVDEAMASFLPIISTSAAGEIGDRVEEGVNGYVVPPGDSVILSERMLNFVNNPELCKKMGEISAQKVAGHTPELWAIDFENMISAIMDGHSS